MLEVPDRLERRPQLRGRRRVERVVLRLHRPAAPLVRPAGEALRHDALHTGGAGRRQQVVRPLRPQPVRHRELAREAAHVRQLRERGHLVDDRVRARRRHGGDDGVSLEPVEDHGIGTQGAQRVGLRSGPGGPRDGVAALDETRDEGAADGAGGAREEDVHGDPTRLTAEM